MWLRCICVLLGWLLDVEQQSFAALGRNFELLDARFTTKGHRSADSNVMDCAVMAQLADKPLLSIAQTDRHKIYTSNQLSTTGTGIQPNSVDLRQMLITNIRT